MNNKTMEADDMTKNYHLLSTDNPVFACYLVWGSILILKLLMMTLITVQRRMSTKTFATPEDAKRSGVEVTLGNPKVERARSAHLNDLENVLPFLITSILYIASNPNTLAACILIRIAVVSRIIHTCVYAFRPVPQPSRAIAFIVTFSITIFMALYVIVVNIKHI